MKVRNATNAPEIHRFLDEAGDTTFYGKGKVNIIGGNGVSHCFILGMVKFKEDLHTVRNQIKLLQANVQNDSYFADIPSIQKKIRDGGFYFHATDDLPEVRKEFYDFINKLDCSFEAIVARKIPSLYETKHNGKEGEFYADLLSHLIKNKLNKGGELILNIASRGKSTKNQNLQFALKKAMVRNSKNAEKIIQTNLQFNVQNHRTEPLLNVADYFCWAVQRVFERGELRYYNFLKDKISMVIDLYDNSKYEGYKNYYNPKNPLTIENKVSK